MTSKVAVIIVAIFSLAVGLANEIRVALVVSSAPASQAAVTTPTPTATLTPARSVEGITPGPGETTYTVVSGDNPWLIAQKVYGNGSKYPLILAANNLTQSSRLNIGMVLVIPVFPGTTATPTATPALPTATPEPLLAAATPTIASPTVIPPTRTSTAAPTATLSPAETLGNMIQQSADPDLRMKLDILGWICAISSLVCAFFSYQTYHRVRRLRRMMIMSQRARARL